MAELKGKTKVYCFSVLKIFKILETRRHLKNNFGPKNHEKRAKIHKNRRLKSDLTPVRCSILAKKLHESDIF